MSEPESSSDNEGSNLTSSQSQGSYGGEVTDVETAQFLFSENCESPDTLRIYKNDQFRNQHVGVIHALFIDECLQKKWLDAVPIGLYYLPPKQVQEMLEENCCFKWQVEDKKNGPKEVHQLQKPKPKKVVHHTKREPKKVIHQWYTNNKSNDMQSEGMAGAGDGDSDRGRRNQSDAAESCRPSSIHCEPSQGHIDMTTRPSADLEDNVSVPETLASFCTLL
ncbi:telomere repeats-binding bouquet formation protein 2-like isoform X2 [Lineus longissimus]|uniref:telomere repeats-binding bouquet formation protein 2-like isoform X2 n=1 Tax=Lineus longissimus TaxID=88925 RepID=UPI00315CF023